MIPTRAQSEGSDSVPLACDADLWDQAIARARASLESSARGASEPSPAALSVACTAALLFDPQAPRLMALLRRSLVACPLGGESAVRCLRVLTRAGERVDLRRLEAILHLTGRPARIALVAVAELAARDGGQPLHLLTQTLQGPLRHESALLLSHLGSPESLDALAGQMRAPGLAGVHAAAALLTFEDDPFAFEVLCERLCVYDEASAAARALWGARPDGSSLLAAESVLARWSRRGAKAAEPGRLLAAALLTAAGISHDLGATQRALGSDDGEIALIGAQAAYSLGDAERARDILVGLLRRGPTLAMQAFRLLAQWANLGDLQAQAILCGVIDRRPVDLMRSAIFEALACTNRPALFQRVARALSMEERVAALDAARALARLRDPPSVIPPLWL